jgi:hypothetical protein
MLVWAELSVPMSVETDVAPVALQNIEEAIEADPDNWQIYADAATFASNFNLFEDEALEWIDKSISLEEHYWNYYIKARLLANKGDNEAAMIAVNKSKELAKMKPDDYEGMKDLYKELEAKL